MKTTLLTACLFAIIAFSACNSGSKKGAEATTDSATTALAAASSTVADPDTTDNIPGDQYGVNTASTETANLVRLTLKDLFKDDLAKGFIPEENRKFIFFEYDLNDDSKKEIFVGLIGGYFCGSGGCTMLLLDNQGNVITYFTVTDYPVVIDNNKTNGWKDLIIMSGGKNHLVKYNGKKYPSNPSVQPIFKMIPGDDLPRALDHVNHPYPWFKF